MKRILSIDLIRGAAMIIMALDHTRDLLHTDALTQSPTDLATTTPFLFFTRWITHLCAPTFVFLSGVSVWLSSNGQPGARENRRFLLRRGIWLVLVEFTLVTFALWTDIRFRTLLFEVIATIGFGFIILSLLSGVAPRILGIVGLILIFGHDLSSDLMSGKSVLQFMGSFLLGIGAYPLGYGYLLIFRYPVLPWLGIMLAGFACGRLFELPAPARQKSLLRIGISALVLFILLRWLNVYGDPSKWSVQKNGVYTFLSFMNISKYPPSLLFTLCTLGILFIGLFFAGDRDNRFTRIAVVYGRTPLFYFIIHLYVIHIVMFVMLFLQGFHTDDLVFGVAKFGRPAKGSGVSLPFIYLLWLGIVAAMYPLCKWYGQYKAAHREKKWLRYL